MHRILQLLLILAVSPAWAQAADPCSTQRSTVEIDECGKLTLAGKDKELNAAYQLLLKRLRAEDKFDDTDYAEVKRQLVEAQRSWIKFRDSDCKGQLALNANGTMRGAIYF